MRRWRPRRPRSLRGRLALRLAVAFFGALFVAGQVVILVATRQAVVQSEALIHQADALVRSEAARLGDEGLCAAIVAGALPIVTAPTSVVVEAQAPDGRVCRQAGALPLTASAPVPDPIRVLLGVSLPQTAGSTRAPMLVLAGSLPSGWVTRVGGDLSVLSTQADQLARAILVVTLLSALVAAPAGLGVARTALRPVRELSQAASRIARTQDLSVRIDVPEGGDEIASMAASFNDMTQALAAARSRQSALVVDAGHELRTPLTSLRTNLELFVRSERAGRPLPPPEREALLGDLVDQLDEITQLVGDLALLAHDAPPAPRRTVRWDEVIANALDRVRRRAVGRVLQADLEPWVLAAADADALERAVVNVLDNAVKFSPPASTVTVVQRAGVLTVDDEGSGVPASLQEAAFERFWRSEEARALPGSGLGLAIVAEVVASHGGTAQLGEAPGGGARLVLTVPGGRSAAGQED
jgi:two-component system, OmpR family, sensor histidine kinase MprB